MKKSFALSASVISGVVMATAFVTPVAAWHPKGEIKKSVQNVTTGGELSDANDEASAVVAKTGDTLKYVVEISNTGNADSRGYNDMHDTVLQDILPVGVDLVEDRTIRHITDEIGVIEPGETVIREYIVKVVSGTDDEVITNKACFTGDSEVSDAPQSGCDDAVIKLDIPQTSSEETDEPSPTGGGEEKETPEVKGVTTLPSTGFGQLASVFLGTTGAGYAVSRVASRRKRD